MSKPKKCWHTKEDYTTCADCETVMFWVGGKELELIQKALGFFYESKFKTSRKTAQEVKRVLVKTWGVTRAEEVARTRREKARAEAHVR